MPAFGLMLILALAAPPTAAASPLSEPAIYYRCHEQFVRRRPEPGDRLLAQVRAGEKRAAEACLELLDEVTLDGHAGVESRSAEILRTFQAFHQSWFSTKDFIRQESENPTSNLYDVNEMGYHLSYSLFAPHAKFSNAVRSSNSFRGVRVATRPATYLVDPDGPGEFPKLTDRKWVLGEDKKNWRPWSPKLAAFGDLVGIVPMSDSENPMSIVDRDGRKLELDASRSFGGGILGSVPYLLLTSTLEQYDRADGGRRSHRSWGRSIFENLLCRGLPVVRKEDVERFVEADSQLPFRRTASCMQCHSSMDPIAETARNIAEVRSGGVEDKIFSSRILVPYPVDRPLKRPKGLGEPHWDPEFYRRPPQGRLYFRDFRGNLVDRSVIGLDQLGQALASSDDLYLCAAKRYFEFMTGIDVQLGDFSVAPLKDADTRTNEFRSFLIHAASGLRSTQSLKALVSEILNSPYYSQSDYGGGGP